MYHNLSKQDKKIARICIDKGLNIAYTNALNEVSSLMQDWHTDKTDTRQAYMKLFKIIEHHDRAIAKRYNDLGGSRYLVTVAALLGEKVISEEDIKDFSGETKGLLNRLLHFYEE